MIDLINVIQHSYETSPEYSVITNIKTMVFTSVVMNSSFEIDSEAQGLVRIEKLSPILYEISENPWVSQINPSRTRRYLAIRD